MIKKVKDWLGIEGVKIQLDIPETFKLKDQEISGTYTITTQSDQFVEYVRLILKERYSRGRRKSKLIDEYILGEQMIEIGQSITKDETILHTFNLEFQSIKSPVERFGDKNFLYRGITSLAKVLKGVKSNYALTAEVIVKGNKLRPYATVEVVVD